jgi:hypothetical protein
MVKLLVNHENIDVHRDDWIGMDLLLFIKPRTMDISQ